ncbi:7-cyano-7-deazaguanine synthase (plasmid) [Rhizobium sp. CB3060]|uniref:7-cyano-7-deazaguanine synthase n=1 Tax=Rhizobium sp. CB3060 TaxID=3138255 RepID=UPI0021A3C850|nr:7-cyano-7-deazaguanine synthase [Rhizobium tropici]UWU25442.1 7-cyano-7-deazaguanine synthase [Rhizobium tropici]
MKLLLYSGGLDSTALAWKFRPDIAVTIDYGQRPAAGEIRAASALCGLMNLRHDVLKVDLAFLGIGTLVGTETADIAAASEWWPYRNQMLITLAGMRYVARGLSEIMIGAVASDVHADGKKPFLAAISSAMIAQEGGVQVSAPAIDMDPLDLILGSGVPKNLLGAAFSCHVAEYPCGQCRGCEKHLTTIAALSNRN